MEKIEKIEESNIYVTTKVVLNDDEDECFVCGTKIELYGDTKEDLFKKLNDEGWKYLNSDQFGAMGYYCGCEYELY